MKFRLVGSVGNSESPRKPFGLRWVYQVTNADAETLASTAMKWFKHMTSLRNDENVARFFDSTGLEGFGFLCMVMEMIAEGMGPADQDCQLSLSLRRWSIALGIHRNKVLSYMSKLESTGLAILKHDGSEIRVQVPNLAKWRDEYTKKSGHYHESVRTNSSQIRSEKIKKLRGPVKTVNAGENSPSGEHIRSVSRVETQDKDRVSSIGNPLDALPLDKREIFERNLREAP